MKPRVDPASLPALHRAAYEGNVGRLAALLVEGADPNEAGCVRDESDGWRSIAGPSYIATPLMLAAASTARGTAGVVRALLDAGADPRLRSTSGNHALMYAAAAGNVRVMRLLLQAGVPADLPCGNTALCVAAEAADLNAVRLLLRYGASPNPVANKADDDPVEPVYSFRIPLFMAAEGGRGECVRLIATAGARTETVDLLGRSALMYASTRPAVRALLDAGCRLDARDAPPLMLGVIDHAARNGHRDVLFALVEAGADVEARSVFGQTPLIAFCSSTEVRAAMVSALIEAGADIHARWFRGRTALHEAAQLCCGERHGNLGDVIRVLVAAGIDVNVRDDLYSTPLHCAVGDEGVDLEAVETLLELGADPDLKNDLGHTPRDYAPDHVRSARWALEKGPQQYPHLNTPEGRMWAKKALEDAEQVVRILAVRRRRA